MDSRSNQTGGPGQASNRHAKRIVSLWPISRVGAHGVGVPGDSRASLCECLSIFFFFFYWNLVTLQTLVSTVRQRESAVRVHISPFLDFLPI